MYSYPFNSSARKPGRGVNAALDDKGRTALHFAVESQNFREVEKLLRIGANPEQQDNAGETPLFIAVRLRNLALVEKLLDKGASFRTTDEKNHTPLDAAIESGCDVAFIEKLRALGGSIARPAENTRSILHTAVEKQAPGDTLAYLVRQGIPVNQQDDKGRTALHLAIENKNYAAMEKLLALGADPVIRDNQISTPLHYAAASGDERAADILLAQEQVRANINAYKTYDKGFTPLMEAVAGNHAVLVEKLARLGGDVNQLDNQKRHSLFIAAELGNLSAARSLVELGADIEKSQRCTANNSPIVHWVNHNNYAEIMLLLHQAGVNLNAQDGSGQTALHKASNTMDREKISTLLGLGANPDIPNEFGKRPLDLVLEHYNYDNQNGNEIVAMLLARRASPDISPAPDIQEAPLHLAARAGKLDVLKLLLQNNAAVDVRDRMSGATPFLLAVEYGHEEAAEILKQAGANVFKQDNEGKTALHLAAIGGNAAIIQALFAEKDMDINARDAQEKTALHYACRLERGQAAKTLLDHGAHPTLYDERGLTPLHAAASDNGVAILDIFAGEKKLKVDLNLPTRDESFTLLHIAVRDNCLQFASRLLELGAEPARPAKNGLIPAHYAILQDRPELAEKLIAAMKHHQASIDRFTDANGWTLLHYAATRETPQMASLLIAAGANAEAVAETGDTPLHIAARAGRRAVVEYLVDNKKTDTNRLNKEGDTPLALALKYGRGEVAAFLKEKTAASTPAEADLAAGKKSARPKGP